MFSKSISKVCSFAMALVSAFSSLSCSASDSFLVVRNKNNYDEYLVCWTASEPTTNYIGWLYRGFVNGKECGGICKYGFNITRSEGEAMMLINNINSQKVEDFVSKGEFFSSDGTIWEICDKVFLDGTNARSISEQPWINFDYITGNRPDVKRKKEVTYLEVELALSCLLDTKAISYPEAFEELLQRKENSKELQGYKCIKSFVKEKTKEMAEKKNQSNKEINGESDSKNGESDSKK